MQPRHVPRLRAAASETTSLLSSQEHQAADTLGAAKQEDKGRGSVSWWLEEDGVLRLLPQGRGTMGREHIIVSPTGGQGSLTSQSTSPRLQNLQLGWRQKPTINPRGGGCFSWRTDSKAGPQETPRTGNRGSAQGGRETAGTQEIYELPYYGK